MFDITKLQCRICFESDETLQDLTDPSCFIEPSTLNTPLSKAFYQITNILVTKNDIAKFICNLCLERLTVSFKFRKEAELANEKIKESKSRIKVEPEPDDNDPLLINSNLIEIKLETKEVVGDKLEPVLSEVPKVLKKKRQRKSENASFLCKFCGVETDSNINLIKHIRFNHTELKQRRSSSKSDSLWVKKQLYLGHKLICDFCNEEFKLLRALSSHIKNNHVQVQSFTCEICSKAFRTPYLRDLHSKKVHTTEYVICEICGKNIKKQSIVGHMQTHNQDKKFKCEECNLVYCHKRSLDDHLKLYHSENDNQKYICKFCGKEFVSKISGRTHERRIHTMENCLQCETCKKWFLNENERQTHINIVHMGQRKYECTLCGIQVSRQYHLNRHIQKSHPDAFDELLEKGVANVRSKKYKYMSS